MNRLSIDQQVRVVACLVEGMSIRATVRMTGAAKDTITKLIREVRAAREAYQRRWLRDLTRDDIQCDEVWSFCYAKQNNLPANHARPRSRLSDKIQLSTDGMEQYMTSVVSAFGADEIDYARSKKYRSTRDDTRAAYSPSRLVSIRKRVLIRTPDEKMLHVTHRPRERQDPLAESPLHALDGRAQQGGSGCTVIRRRDHVLPLRLCTQARERERPDPAMGAHITSHPFMLRDMVFEADQARAA